MFDINICLTVYMHAHIAMHSEQPICQKMYRLKKKKKTDAERSILLFSVYKMFSPLMPKTFY